MSTSVLSPSGVGHFEPYVPEEIRTIPSPERTLLAAVLYRAFWDLNYISTEKTLVKDAVTWFRARPKKDPKKQYFLSFVSIKRTNDYADSMFARADRAVADAEEFLDFFRGVEPDKMPDHRARVAWAKARGHYFSDPAVRNAGGGKIFGY